MDPESLVSAASAALLGAMATDAWEQTRTIVAGWWRRIHPERAETVAAELEQSRAELLAARDAGDTGVESDLLGDWRTKLRRLLREDPDLAVEIQRVLVSASFGTGEQADVAQTVTVRDHGRAYVAGRDQHIREG